MISWVVGLLSCSIAAVVIVEIIVIGWAVLVITVVAIDDEPVTKLCSTACCTYNTLSKVTSVTAVIH